MSFPGNARFLEHVSIPGMTRVENFIFGFRIPIAFAMSRWEKRRLYQNSQDKANDDQRRRAALELEIYGNPRWIPPPLSSDPAIRFGWKKPAPVKHVKPLMHSKSIDPAIKYGWKKPAALKHVRPHVPKKAIPPVSQKPITQVALVNKTALDDLIDVFVEDQKKSYVPSIPWPHLKKRSINTGWKTVREIPRNRFSSDARYLNRPKPLNLSKKKLYWDARAAYSLKRPWKHNRDVMGANRRGKYLMSDDEDDIEEVEWDF